MNYLICTFYIVVLCHWIYVTNKHAYKFANKKYNEWFRRKK